MGTWGVEPRDNDSTQDFVFDIDEDVNKLLGKRLTALFKDVRGKPHDYWLVGLVQEFAGRGHAIPATVLRKSLRILDQCLADKKFVSDWKDYSSEFKVAARRLRKKIAAVVEDYAALSKKSGGRIPKLVQDDRLLDERCRTQSTPLH